MKKLKKLQNCLVLFIFLGCYLSSFGQVQDGNQLIKFKDKNVHIFTKGLKERLNNEPIIIFESALGTPLENWNGLIKKMSDSLPIFAYDRAGIGKSDLVDQEPTPEFTTNRLHEILKQLKIQPPYILVGHSWGGEMISAYAVKYPEEVVGLVYVDATDIINRNENFIEAIKRASNGKETTNVIQEKMSEAFGQAPPGVAAEFKVVNQLTIDEQLDSSKFTPSKKIPTAILTSGRYDPPPVDLGISTFDPKDFYNELVKLRIEKYLEQINGNQKGIFLHANNLGHLMHAENPKLVANIVEEIYSLSK